MGTSQAATNVVLFLTDDHGQWANGCYGNAEVRTPNLDYLSSGGVRMDAAFTPTPVCSPARACLLTGLVSSQHGIHDWLREQEPEVGGRDWLRGLPTLPEVLSQAGYRCMLSGKWHLGRSEQVRPGFRDYFAIGQPQGGHRGPQRYSDQGRIVTLDGFKTDIVAERAVQFLRDAHREDHPFFLQVGFIGTHSVWKGHPDRLVAGYRTKALTPVWNATEPQRVDGGPGRIDPREALAQYYAAVTHIDENVGRILDTLEALQLRERTLVIYTSDHGLALGQHGVWGKGNGTSPRNMFEASIRVPLIWNHPGTLPADRASDLMVDHCDLYCTLLDYLGIDVWRHDRRLSGASYLPTLRGEVQAWDNVYIGEYGPLRCIRTRDTKLVRRYHHGGDEFYDLGRDPGEGDNLIQSPSAQAAIAELGAALQAFYERYEDPARSGLRYDPYTHGVSRQYVADLKCEAEAMREESPS